MKKKKIKPYKPLTDAEAKKIIGGSLEYWGTAEDALPKPKNLSNGVSLAPVDKDGNDGEISILGSPFNQT